MHGVVTMNVLGCDVFSQMFVMTNKYGVGLGAYSSATAELVKSKGIKVDENIRPLHNELHC